MTDQDSHRGWAPDDDANEGLDERKAATDRLNAESNQAQQAASRPKAAEPLKPDEELEG